MIISKVCKLGGIGRSFFGSTFRAGNHIIAYMSATRFFGKADHFAFGVVKQFGMLWEIQFWHFEKAAEIFSIRQQP